MVFLALKALASAALLVNVAAHPSMSTNPSSIVQRGVAPAQCESGIPAVDIAGEYINTMDGAKANDWHYVTITGSGGTYKWSNKAGVSWSLRRDKTRPNLFHVGKENPYFDDGYTTAVVKDRMTPKGTKEPTAIQGPFKEEYTLASLVEPWNPVFCQFGNVDKTCWADDAYKLCPSDRQGAYDAVMAESKGGQEAMYYKYLCVVATC